MGNDSHFSGAVNLRDGLCRVTTNTDAEARTTSAALSACCTLVGFASQYSGKMRSAGQLPRVIFRTNVPGSSEPRAANGKRSAVSTRKVVLTGQDRRTSGPPGRETDMGRCESNNTKGIGRCSGPSEHLAGEVLGPATGQVMDRATWRATREAILAAIWRATDRATWRATGGATQTATARATGGATGRAAERATETATRTATGRTAGQATPRATGTATGRTTHATTGRATGTATGPAAGGTMEGTFGKAQ